MRTTAVALVAAMLAAPGSAAHADSSLAGRAEAAAQAASSRVTTTQANATMAFLIPLRISDPRIGPTFGFDVADVDTGESVFSTSGGTPFLPASTMKIVTALTALKVLGPDARMTTETLVPEPGSVILRGGGDTTLGVSKITRLARRTAAHLKANDLLAPLVERPAFTPATCTVDGQRRKSTERRPCPQLTPEPYRPAVEVHVDDSLYSKPSSGPGWVSSYQPGIARPVRSLGRLGVYQWDSAMEAGKVFASALSAAGVRARAVGHRDAAADLTAVAGVPSRTVAAQVKEMLRVSENNIAEMLFRQVAVERGRRGSWKGGRLAARDTMRELGLSTARLKLYDGSGLSRADRLTPNFLTDLLRVAQDTQTHPQFASFLKSLPVGGRSGTLAPQYRRFTTAPSSCAAGEVFAKTGTLYDTIGLSGYTRGEDGALKAFAALVNDRPQRFSPQSTREAVDGLVATVNGCWGPTRSTGQPPGIDEAP
jgi:D-alanyl-D-alanine carboxypeptidase/D-alanyl-D-alanine-endopeptidase (penicillin-binding protein 4)